MTRWLLWRLWVRRAVGFAALGVFSALVASAGASRPASAEASSTGGQARGTLVVAERGDAPDLDPHTRGSANVANVRLYAHVYDTLTTMNGLNVRPSLATSWKQVSRKVWIFNIRRQVRFSNGRQMTVNDVVGSLRRLLDPKNNAILSSRLGPVGNVSASGRWQVKITMQTPNPGLPSGLASAGIVLPMKELNARTFDPAKQLLGTGPFRVVAHIKDESWTFARNRHYWRAGLPKVNRLVVRVIPDDSARIAALRNGSIDITTFDRPDAVRLLRGVRNVKTVTQNTTDFNWVAINALRPSIFADRRLRQAVSLAIDRNQIINVALGGVGQPTAAVPAPFGTCDPGSMPFAKPNLQAARNLVAAAGATGKSVTIIAVASDVPQPSIAQVLQQNLNAIGLNARILQLDLGDVRTRTRSEPSDFDLWPSWLPGFTDPAAALRWFNPALSGFGRGFFAPNEELNRSILRSLITSSGPARTRHISAACRQAAQHANLIPLTTRKVVVGYRSDRVTARIRPVEGLVIPLRGLAEFGLRK